MLSLSPLIKEPVARAAAGAQQTMSESPRTRWSYLSSHAHVLLYLARHPTARLRDLADAVGITERAIQRLIVDLEAAGAITREREGRRNRYTICGELPLRHTLEEQVSIGDLIEAVNRNVTEVAGQSAAVSAITHLDSRREPVNGFARGGLSADEMARIKRAAQYRLGR